MLKTLSNRTYNLLIGVMLLYGFIVNFVTVKLFTNTFKTWNPSLVLIGYFLIAVSGIVVHRCSKKPLTSFIGYNLIVLPISPALSLVLRTTQTDTLIRTIITTAAVTLAMIIIATIKPQLFSSLCTTLLTILLLVITVEVVLLLFGVAIPKWWDILMAFLFCVYVGFDWSLAQQREHTVKNAMDAVINLYLDIINIFVRLIKE